MANSTLRKRFKEAQKVNFPGVEESSNTFINDFIKAHCDAIGCPREFLFFPFLSTFAGFMGSKAVIKVHEEWKEPAILWSIIAACKGERKSPALKRIKDAVFDIQNKKQKTWAVQNENKQDTPTRANKHVSSPPQLLIDVFSMEELHNVLQRNNYQIIGIYEEIKVLHQSLDIYKPGGSLVDRKQFLNLNGGSSWDRNFKNSGYCHLPSTHFNHTGMIQPIILSDMMDRDDWDGFNDRYLLSCPKEVTYRSQDYVVPVPGNMKRSFEQMFNVIAMKHEEVIEYCFSAEAKLVFDDYHDNYFLVMKKKFEDDENRRGVLSKSLGYIVRLAGILTAMDNASTVVKDNLDLDTYSWTVTISASIATKAIMLMKYFNDTKFCLLPEVVNSRTENLDTASSEDKDQSFILENQQKIKRILEYDSEEAEISSSIACRNALFPPVSKDERGASSNRFPSWAAEKFFKDISSLGFGDVEQKSHSLNKSSSLVFRKRKLEELSEPHLELIKKLKISNEKYMNGTRDTSNKENQI